MKHLDSEFWDQHWSEKRTPWDLGGHTRGLEQRVDRAQIREKRVLVPGCGGGHDANYLAGLGATVTAVDISSQALAHAARRYGNAIEWCLGNVLDLPFENEFDYVWEYTCYCALGPEDRDRYLESVVRSLRLDGKFFGMVFRSVPDPENGPPYQVDPAIFRSWLERHLEIERFEVPSQVSIGPRMGKEIWFESRLALTNV